MDKMKKPVEKKSLLQKYDIPIEHLSYEYISECTHAKELERIVIVLRSGEEGCYPDLTKRAEERLSVIKPGSAVLRVVEPALKSHMLERENRIILDNDLNEWMSEMKMREKDLEEGRAMEIKEPIFQPAIRQITLDNHEEKKPPSVNEKKSKRIAGCDYAEWDKYDVDTELKRIDLRQQQKQAQAKRAQKILRDKEEKMKKTSREETIDKLTLTGTELSIMAEKEREKGNEAFKAGDYEEALNFYSASIAVDATINAYNNRAIANIKLQRYNEAVKDCNSVISMDSTNIKALLRRASALDHLEKRAQSLADYEAVLKLQPSNKIAIEALNKLRGPCDSKKIRMKIEESSDADENPKPALDDSSSLRSEAENSNNVRNGSETPCSAGDRSKILSERKTSSRNVNSLVYEPFKPTSNSKISSRVCFCAEAPSSSRHLSPQPHFRDVYCSGGPESDVKKSKKQSIYTDNKMPRGESSRVLIEEIPSEPCEKTREKFKSEANGLQGTRRDGAKSMNFGSGDNKFTVKSGIFLEELSTAKTNNDRFNESASFENALDDTENSFENTSGVIIEEIPNELWEKPETNSPTEKLKSHGENRKAKAEVEKNSAPPEAADGKDEKIDRGRCGISEIPSRTKLPSSGTESPPEVTAAKVPEARPEMRQNDGVAEEANGRGKIDEISKHEDDIQPSIFLNGKKDKIVGQCGSLADKSPKEINVDELTKAQTFELTESPYEFFRLWHSIKNDRDSSVRARLLKALPPQNIETVIGNKLDGEMLSTILTCLENHFCSAEDSTLLIRFLLYLGKVERFSIVKMFMDDGDKKVLESILLFLRPHVSEDIISDLRQIYEM